MFNDFDHFIQQKVIEIITLVHVDDRYNKRSDTIFNRVSNKKRIEYVIFSSPTKTILPKIGLRTRNIIIIRRILNILHTNEKSYNLSYDNILPSKLCYNI